jgi:hypothetical protein
MFGHADLDQCADDPVSPCQRAVRRESERDIELLARVALVGLQRAGMRNRAVAIGKQPVYVSFLLACLWPNYDRWCENAA